MSSRLISAIIYGRCYHYPAVDDTQISCSINRGSVVAWEPQARKGAHRGPLPTVSIEDALAGKTQPPPEKPETGDQAREAAKAPDQPKAKAKKGRRRRRKKSAQKQAKTASAKTE